MNNMLIEHVHSKLDKSIVSVKRVLENNRNPQPADVVNHKYSDKYLLIDFLTTAASSSVLMSLEVLSELTNEQLKQSLDRMGNRSATLRFKRQSKFNFIKKEERQVEDSVKNVTNISGATNLQISTGTVTTITTYYWNYNTTCEYLIYFGSNPEDCISLSSKSFVIPLETRSESPPQLNQKTTCETDLNISWLLRLLNDHNKIDFNINRSLKNCFTPRRNPDIDTAVTFFTELNLWSGSIKTEMTDLIEINQQNNKCDLNELSGGDIFIPVVPLLEDTEQESPAVLSSSDLQLFLDEENRSLRSKLSEVQKCFSNEIGNIKSSIVITQHTIDVCGAYEWSISMVEEMLRKQLISAIGKEITPSDFSNYMSWHVKKIFNKEYLPRTFSYAVRVPGHHPEGTVNFEQINANDIDEPVLSVVNKKKNNKLMKFDLNASSEISFSGNIYTHSIVNHRFSTHTNRFNLVANTRQFSSFIIILGTIGSGDVFLPKHAFILNNKDELKIPLDLEEVPSLKQFKSSIESLSPEQQRFAKAYRSMQLEATLFGVCVIQTKPQIERVLNLPVGSLTKELELCQNVTELFTTYQTSADLLSYQCDDCESDTVVTATVKIDQVKESVAQIRDIIKSSKEEELEEQRRIVEAEKLRQLQLLHQQQQQLQQQQQQQQQQQLQQQQQQLKHQAIIAHKDKKLQRRHHHHHHHHFQHCRDLSESNTMVFSGSKYGSHARMSSVSSNDYSQRSRKVTDSSQPVEKPLLERKPHQQQSTELISSIPNLLEANFEKLDSDGTLRPTIIKPTTGWLRTYVKGLLGKQMTQTLHKDELQTEKEKALNLLDILTRSGEMEIPDAELHVVMMSTHCFDKTLLDTVIKDNVNPIEKVERSILIAASTIHGEPVRTLLNADQIERIQSHSPQLF